MKLAALMISAVLLFSYLPLSHGGNETMTLGINGEKILTFPFGTELKIKQIKGKVIVARFCGIYRGERKLILAFHSEDGGEVRIDYEISPSNFPDTYEFLIVCPDGWKDVVQRFKEHKEAHGIKTMVVGLNEIYGGKYFATQGRDDAEKIKYFIKDAIEQWGIKYVLLVGGRKPGMKEEWLMPVRYSYLNDRSSSWEYERRFISDLYYADIYDGNGNFSSWDSNENGYYGEYDHELNGEKLKDRVDLIPDVYLGRIMARNRMELGRVLDNIIQYENNPAGIKEAIMCGGDLYLHDPWDVAEGEHLLDAIAERMHGYQIEKIYASQEFNAKKINEAINEGAEFVFFEGAGNHHLWATHPKDDEKWIFYYERNILALKNSHLPIVMTSGARLGQFNKTRECFNWFFVAKGKAVASIGSTGLCWIGHGPNITTMFLGNLHLRMAEKMADGNFLGDAWGDAIAEYLCNFSWDGVAKAFHMKAAEEIEIFGDPTLKIGGYASKDAIAYGNVLHVGGSGKGNYSRIEDALNASMDGDIIIVHPGIYRENFSVNNSVTIIGKDAKIKTDGIKIYADGVAIENFSIEGYGGGRGIICYGNAIHIHGNEISKFNNTIEIYGKGCMIDNNMLKSSRCGVWLNESVEERIDNNTLYNLWYGVWGERCSDAIIIHNNFSYNHWYAVWMEGSNGIICCNNFIHNWYSVYFYNSNGFSLRDNFILLNIHGPQFVNSSSNEVEGNVMERNEHYGIYFGWRSKNNTVTHNDFINNAQNARDDGHNKWDENYWSDYIGVKIKIFYFLHFPYYIQSLSFDWHPLPAPQNIY